MDPLRFHPIIKQIRWGGRQLGTRLGKPIGPDANYAESWEICDHGVDQSVVATGPWKGWNLEDLVKQKADDLFGPAKSRKQFPLLIKFLDCQDRLSVQVHPNDEQARQADPTENGKSEAWVILDAQADSRIYAGLKAGIDRTKFEESIAENRIKDCLHEFPARRGDTVYIPAGTVHAIGEGILLTEVQQSSDLTYRLYDWGRLGADGQPRELHIAQALECIDFERGPVEPVIPTETQADGHLIESLVECQYFTMRRRTSTKSFEIPTGDGFRVVIVLEGCGTLTCNDNRDSLKTGDTVLIPSSCPQARFDADEQLVLLEAALP